MARKKKSLPIYENVEIVGIAAEGKAIAKVEDMIVFVPYVITGDIADIQITKRRSRYMEGRAIRIVQHSENREKPFCPHYGTCGGCKWQILPYPEQLKEKERQVADALERIGHLTLPKISPIIGSDATQAYRNKMEYTFSNKRWRETAEMQQGCEDLHPEALGFHIPGMFDKVLDITYCGLQDNMANEIRNFVRDYALREGISFFDLKNQDGMMRNLVIRNTTTGEWMVIVVFHEEDETIRQNLLEAIRQQFPQITSLLYVINSKANDSIADLQVNTYFGRDAIHERMGNLTFKIGPKSFYQTNSKQAEKLYGVVKTFAQLTGNECVYDLYTGTGTIANFVADKAKSVIGIEYVEDAIADARINAQENGISNTRFYAGDMKDILTENFIAEHGKPDVIITDPPRAGMHADVIKTILGTNAKKIVYVSCNPATQARDLVELCSKYDITAVQPVDMFPHTHHVENVVLLTRKPL